MLSGAFDAPWLADLEASQTKSVYGTSSAFLRLSVGKDSWKFDDREWMKDVETGRETPDSLSTVQELDEKELPRVVATDKRVGRVFDEMTGSRFHSTGVI